MNFTAIVYLTLQKNIRGDKRSVLTSRTTWVVSTMVPGSALSSCIPVFISIPVFTRPPCEPWTSIKYDEIATHVNLRYLYPPSETSINLGTPGVPDIDRPWTLAWPNRGCESAGRNIRDQIFGLFSSLFTVVFVTGGCKDFSSQVLIELHGFCKLIQLHTCGTELA